MLKITWAVSRKSISFKLVMGVLIIMLPMIGFLIYNNYYAIHVVHNEVAESYKTMMSLYVKQIDSTLEDVDGYLSTIEALNTDLQIMNFSAGQSDYTLAKIRLRTKIADEIAIYKPVSSVFVYAAARHDFMKIENTTVDNIDQQQVVEYLMRACDAEAKNNKVYNRKWYVKEINQDYYLFRILKMDECYIGAWIDIKNLLVPLNKSYIGGEGTFLLVADDGQPMLNRKLVEDTGIDLKLDMAKYHISGRKKKYLVAGENSGRGNFSLMVLIPDTKILERLPYFKNVITFISFGLSALVPVGLIFVRNVVLVPLKRMLAVMRRIQQGNLDERIELKNVSEEFLIVNETFNKMMSQIHDLKINVYEEKINRQKAELQHLQLQMKPHFFLNTLNIIHLLAKSKNYELIQEMTQCLILYLRYVFRSNLTFIPMKEELKHVKNFIRIQELRLDKKFTYTIDVPEFLSNTPVPPLIIQTFVENSLKYAVTLDDKVSLSVLAELVDIGEPEPYLKILVCDTGKGFENNVLSELREGNRIVDRQGEHIGIWNVIRRLQLLYKEQAQIYFRNGETGGAVIEILLPIIENKLNTEVQDG